MSRSDPAPFPPFPVESSEEIYRSPFCSLRLDRIRLPDGRLQNYDVFELAPAVVVVPVLPDGSIVFLWQYRYPHGRSHWELPAGHVEPGEEPEAAARRELLEETGYRAGALERASGFYPINGISPHYAHIYVATGCERDGSHRPEGTEVMSVHVLPREEARARLLAGELEDGFSALALFFHLARGAR